MNLTEAHKAAAFEWLRYLAERRGNFDGLDRKQAEIALRAWHDAEERADHLKLQAETHAQEARTAKATIHEIYQLCTGATGEPGSWNGAEPVRQLLKRAQRVEAGCERLRARERQLYDALWTLNGHARLYMTLAQNVDGQTREALATPLPESEPPVQDASADEASRWERYGRAARIFISGLESRNPGILARFDSTIDEADKILPTKPVALQPSPDDAYPTPEQSGDALAALDALFFNDHPNDPASRAAKHETVRNALTASGLPYVLESARELPEKWRGRVEQYEAYESEVAANQRGTFRQCANELEVAPASAPAVPDDKYTPFLGPFVRLMNAELHANAGKGDRQGWLSMSSDQAMLEIYYHAAKLQKAVRDGDGALIREHSADVANMSMMLLDLCVGLTDMEDAAAPTHGGS